MFAMHGSSSGLAKGSMSGQRVAQSKKRSSAQKKCTIIRNKAVAEPPTTTAATGARVVSDNMENVLSIILGGGAGSRLYPLTKKRAKPAVPLGANYRLIDIPVSNCINSDINKIYCLTQFNSASLNRHLAQAYNANIGSYTKTGFVEVLAANSRRRTRLGFKVPRMPSDSTRGSSTPPSATNISFCPAITCTEWTISRLL